MSSVHARYIASAAAVAALIVENRKNYGISFDVVVVDDRLRRASDYKQRAGDRIVAIVFINQFRLVIRFQPVPAHCDQAV